MEDIEQRRARTAAGRAKRTRGKHDGWARELREHGFVVLTPEDAAAWRRDAVHGNARVEDILNGVAPDV